MHPTDATPATISREPIDPTTVTSGLQAPRACTATPSPVGRRKILLCENDPWRREDHRTALSARGHEVVLCDPTQPYTFTSFERLLSEAAVVRFDCSMVTLDAFRRLLHVCDHRQRHGLKPFLVCTAINPNERFNDHLHNVLRVDRTVNCSNRIGGDQSDPPLRASFNPTRWGLQIVHRWWVGETICTPGEELHEIRAFNNLQTESLPLCMKDSVALDQFVRGKVPQSSTQWAETMNASVWVSRHGSRSSPPLKAKYQFSRTGLKQSIWRLRSAVSAGFRKVGVEIDPKRIIESTPCGREVKYRWNPEIFVVWEHLEC
jgi:hypothetical protein